LDVLIIIIINQLKYEEEEIAVNISSHISITKIQDHFLVAWVINDWKQS